jgi:hypothetical protein
MLLHALSFFLDPSLTSGGCIGTLAWLRVLKNFNDLAEAMCPLNYAPLMIPHLFQFGGRLP